MALWHQRFWSPPCRQFVHSKDFSLNSVDLAICWIEKHLSFKTIQWMSSTCSTEFGVFGCPDFRSSSVLSLAHLNFAAHFITEGESSAWICTVSSWISLSVIHFLCRWFMTVWAFVCLVHFCSCCTRLTFVYVSYAGKLWRKSELVFLVL